MTRDWQPPLPNMAAHRRENMRALRETRHSGSLLEARAGLGGTQLEKQSCCTSVTNLWNFTVELLRNEHAGTPSGADFK